MKTKNIYEKALNNGYALGAFNFVNLDMLKAILQGATNCNSPVILQMSTSAMDFFGDEYIKCNIKEIKNISKIPVIFHLDHGKKFEDSVRAISLGFDSVMIDASSLTYEENVNLTKKVVDYAHKKKVWVEAELGQLKGIEDEVSSENNVYTDPNQAKDFVTRTKCDSLAVAIGTSHGAYKFSGEPKLRFDILEQIQSLLPKYPLVLHGSSSIPQDCLNKINQFGGDIKGAKGIPEDLLKKACIDYNIVKINMDSDLRLAYTAQIRESFYLSPDNFDLRKYIKPAMNSVTELVEHKIKNVLNSQNKA